MRIFATGRTAYTLVNKDGSFAGSLIYTDNSLSEASLKCGEYIYRRKTRGQLDYCIFAG